MFHYYTCISYIKLVLTPPFSLCYPKFRRYPRLDKISRFFTLILANGVNAAENASRLYDEPPTPQF